VTRNVTTRDFLKKFLSYVKSVQNPELNGECTDYAAQLYSVIRQKAAYADQSKISCPVTVRTLETMIRLATAHAKLHLLNCPLEVLLGLQEHGASRTIFLLFVSQCEVLLPNGLDWHL